MWKVLILSLLVTCSYAAVEDDKITSLPGIQFQINFNQYSGYLNPDNATFFHYWFLESQNDPSTDPLVLWLNGGPGCSSLFGLLSENGPFTVVDSKGLAGNATEDSHSTLSENVYAWNKVANMLYIESPAWVGFSYSFENVTYDDDETAQLNYKALIDFFGKYPEFSPGSSNRSFYITGESYGGVYLPMLADLLIQNATILPYFKGVAIGNGYLSQVAQADSVVPLMYTHNLVGEKLWNDVSVQCCNGNGGICDYFSIINTHNLSDPCYNWTLLISNMPAVVGLDPYNLYDTCYVDTSIQTQTRSVEYLSYLNRYNVDIETIREIARDNGITPMYTDSASAVVYPDCYFSGYIFYLQRPDVRTALHIPDFLPPWTDCNLTINAIYKQQYLNQSAHLQQILAKNVPILCYNGDVDTVCNALGDQRFVHALGRQQIDATVPWNYTSDTFHVAGWQSRYEGIDFLTVRGSGHYVPHDKPREALQMITNFIRNREYSTPTGINVTPQRPISAGVSAGFFSCGIMFVSLLFSFCAYLRTDF
jgi:cathepsin A (carboxypeptidase C)